MRVLAANECIEARAKSVNKKVYKAAAGKFFAAAHVHALNKKEEGEFVT